MINNNVRRVGKMIKVEDPFQNVHVTYMPGCNEAVPTETRRVTLDIKGVPVDYPEDLMPLGKTLQARIVEVNGKKVNNSEFSPNVVDVAADERDFQDECEEDRLMDQHYQHTERCTPEYPQNRMSGYSQNKMPTVKPNIPPFASPMMSVSPSAMPTMAMGYPQIARPISRPVQNLDDIDDCFEDDEDQIEPKIDPRYHYVSEKPCPPDQATQVLNQYFDALHPYIRNKETLEQAIGDNRMKELMCYVSPNAKLTDYLTNIIASAARIAIASIIDYTQSVGTIQNMNETERQLYRVIDQNKG